MWSSLIELCNIQKQPAAAEILSHITVTVVVVVTVTVTVVTVAVVVTVRRFMPRRKKIANLKSLTKSDLPLLNRMYEKAVEFTEQGECLPTKQSADILPAAALSRLIVLDIDNQYNTMI